MVKKNTLRLRFTIALQVEIESRENEEEILELASTAKKHIRMTRAFGKGTYRCPNGHSWSSHKALVSFDMRKEELKYIFHQKCATCHSGYMRPYFSDSNIREMAAKAVDFFLQKCERDPDELIDRATAKGTTVSQKPHRVDLCEACEHNCCSSQILKKERTRD